jgi:hypothetical protein
MVMPTGDHDHIGCFTDQVKLTHALVRDLDEAVKEVTLLGEHKEESSQKITELEALCKRLREDAQKLKEEKTALEGMIQSRDELIMEMAEEYGFNRMGENDDDEDEDDNNEGNVVTPPKLAPAAVPEEIIEEEAPMEMVPEQEAPVAHEVILADAVPEPPQPRLFNMIMRDYDESPLRMENGLHELDDLDDLYDLDRDSNEDHSDMDEWFPKNGSNDQD